MKVVRFRSFAVRHPHVVTQHAAIEFKTAPQRVHPLRGWGQADGHGAKVEHLPVKRTFVDFDDPRGLGDEELRPPGAPYTQIATLCV